MSQVLDTFVPMEVDPKFSTEPLGTSYPSLEDGPLLTVTFKGGLVTGRLRTPTSLDTVDSVHPGGHKSLSEPLGVGELRLGIVEVVLDSSLLGALILGDLRTPGLGTGSHRPYSLHLSFL